MHLSLTCGEAGWGWAYRKSVNFSFKSHVDETEICIGTDFAILLIISENLILNLHLKLDIFDNIDKEELGCNNPYSCWLGQYECC